MTESDIINKWISLGWNNAEEYHTFIKRDDKPIINDFHPDIINPKIFWSAADEHFKTDPVANSNTSTHVMSINESIWNNHRIAKYTGMINHLEYLSDLFKLSKKSLNIAEIGCGYGSFYYNYALRNNLKYTGFDIIKRFDDAEELKGEDGTFSYIQELKYKNEFNVFYSSNTFQHLSPKQIKKYLHQIYDMLPSSGFFNLMYVFDIDNTYHYGQQVEIIEENNFVDLVRSVGYNIVQQSKQFIGDIKPMTFLLSK